MIFEGQRAGDSRLGQIELSPEVQAVDQQLKSNPDNAQLWMERGLHLAAINMQQEAVEAFSNAIALEPFAGIFYRHRGHRYLACWEFEQARADFVTATRLIPEDWDVWYHLGLCHYLFGEYEKAAKAYRACYELSASDDKLIAVCDWYWMTLMRLGRKEEAQKLLDGIRTDMDAGANTAYYLQLLLYKGLKTPEELTQGVEDDLQAITRYYGLSNYYFFRGEMEKSNAVIDQILQLGDKKWNTAFGYLAARVDKCNRAALPANRENV